MRPQPKNKPHNGRAAQIRALVRENPGRYTRAEVAACTGANLNGEVRRALESEPELLEQLRDGKYRGTAHISLPVPPWEQVAAVGGVPDELPTASVSVVEYTPTDETFETVVATEEHAGYGLNALRDDLESAETEQNAGGSDG